MWKGPVACNRQIEANYLENCNVALHVDNRGSDWEHSSAAFPEGDLWKGVGSVKPYDQPWAAYKLWLLDYAGLPVNTTLHLNTICKCGYWTDFDVADAATWLVRWTDNYEGCRTP